MGRNRLGVKVQKLIRRTWMKYALKGVASADAYDRLNRAYVLEDPWHLGSKLESARFDWTNELIRSRIGSINSILEVGCGEGHQTMRLQAMCPNVFGIDVSSRAIERAQRRVPGAKFAVADLFTQPWGKERSRFDLVTACEVLYYVSDVGAAVERMSLLGRHCLVTIFAPSARRVVPFIKERVANRRDWFWMDDTVWIAGWWSNE